MALQKHERTLGAPWYRQFWPWFLIALPLSSVIAGLTTAWIAVSDADSLVRPDWYAGGRDINQTIGRDNEATRRGLSVRLEMFAIDGRVTARYDDPSGASAPDSLDLVLRHPTHADRDRSVRLQRAESGEFMGELALGAADVWILELTPPDAAWRLGARTALPSADEVVLGRRS